MCALVPIKLYLKNNKFQAGVSRPLTLLVISSTRRAIRSLDAKKACILIDITEQHCLVAPETTKSRRSFLNNSYPTADLGGIPLLRILDIKCPALPAPWLYVEHIIYVAPGVPQTLAIACGQRWLRCTGSRGRYTAT